MFVDLDPTPSRLAMKIFVTFLAFAPLCGVFGLWPLPRTLQTGTTVLKLAPNFDIHVNVQHAPSDLSDAVLRTKSHLMNDKLGRLVVGRGSSDSAAIQHAKSLASLKVALSKGATVRSIAEEARVSIETRSEEYSLTLPADGSAATLTANSTLGLYRGLTTFEQLWYQWSGNVYTVEAPIVISDSPAYVSESLMSLPAVLILSLDSHGAGSCSTHRATCKSGWSLVNVLTQGMI